MQFFLQTAARKITELHNVNANIKRKLKAMKEEKEIGQLLAEDENDEI